MKFKWRKAKARHSVYEDGAIKFADGTYRVLQVFQGQSFWCPQCGPIEWAASGQHGCTFHGDSTACCPKCNHVLSQSITQDGGWEDVDVDQQGTNYDNTGRPTMDLDTQRAVEQSVRHWGRILAMVPGESPVAEQCPLCRKYPTDSCTNFWVNGINRLEFNDWGSCPIAVRVGVPGCEYTPWEDAFNSYGNRIAEDRSFYTGEERKAIRRERNWLRSFLPTLQMVPYV